VSWDAINCLSCPGTQLIVCRVLGRIKGCNQLFAVPRGAIVGSSLLTTVVIMIFMSRMSANDDLEGWNWVQFRRAGSGNTGCVIQYSVPVVDSKPPARKDKHLDKELALWKMMAEYDSSKITKGLVTDARSIMKTEDEVKKIAATNRVVDNAESGSAGHTSVAAEDTPSPKKRGRPKGSSKQTEIKCKSSRSYHLSTCVCLHLSTRRAIETTEHFEFGDGERPKFILKQRLDAEHIPDASKNLDLQSLEPCVAVQAVKQAIVQHGMTSSTAVGEVLASDSSPNSPSKRNETLPGSKRQSSVEMAPSGKRPRGEPNYPEDSSSDEKLAPEVQRIRGSGRDEEEDTAVEPNPMENTAALESNEQKDDSTDELEFVSNID